MGSGSSGDELEIDIRTIIDILKKWGKLIIGMSLITVTVVGLISYFVLVPTYQAKTLLMVTQTTDRLQNTAPRGNDLEGVVNSVSSIPVLTMSTYLGQLKSESLLQRVKDRLQLSYSLGGLSSMINASVANDTNLIEIRVTNESPELAARIANVLCEEYQQLMNEQTQEQMDRSVVFLEEQKSLTDQELAKATESLKDYQSQPRGVMVLENEFNSKSNDMVSYSSRLKMLQVEIQQLHYGVSSIEEELLYTPQRIVVDRWNDAGGELNQVETMNQLYLSLSQDLVTRKASLAEKQGEYNALSQLVASSRADLDSLQAELTERRIAEEDYTREVDRLRETSETLARKTTETQIAKSIDLGDTSVLVISEASIPGSPIKPNKKMNMAYGLFAALMVFTLLAFVLEYLDNTIKTADDVGKYLQLPVLGVIPAMNDKNSRHS